MKSTALRISLIALFCITYSVCFANLDSLGIEYIDGKKFILHKVEPKETYYSIARRYQMSPTILISNNVSDSILKIGNIVRVPVAYRNNAKGTNPATMATATPIVNTAPNNVGGKKYVVQPKETLFAISRKFGVTIDDLKKWNDLSDNSLSIGQEIVVSAGKPSKNTTTSTVNTKPITTATPVTAGTSTSTPPVATNNPKPTTTNTTNTTYNSSKPTPVLNTNRPVGNIKEVNESGMGIAIGDDSLDPNKSLALHRTAPVGTIMKITYPLNEKKVYVKVIGKIPETPENQNVLIILSKTAAELLGATDEKFQVNLNYGVAQ